MVAITTPRHSLFSHPDIDQTQANDFSAEIPKILPGVVAWLQSAVIPNRAYLSGELGDANSTINSVLRGQGDKFVLKTSERNEQLSSPDLSPFLYANAQHPNIVGPQEALSNLLRLLGTYGASPNTNPAITTPLTESVGSAVLGDRERMAMDAYLIFSNILDKMGVAAKHELSIGQQRRADYSKKHIEESARKIEEWLKAIDKRDNPSFWDFLGVIVSAIVAVVAVVAAVATGGLAIGAAACACAAFAMTALDFASKLSVANGGPAFGVGKMFAEMLKSFGVEANLADKLGEWISLGVQVALAVGGTAASMASKAPAVLAKLARMAQAADVVASGGSAIERGINEIKRGHHQSEAMKAEAKAKEATAWLKRILAAIEELQRDFSGVIEKQKEAVEDLSSVLKSAHESRLQTTNLA